MQSSARSLLPRMVGFLSYTHEEFHLTPTLSPNFVGGEGEETCSSSDGLRLHSIHHFVQRVFDDAFGAGDFELRDQLAHDVLVYDRFHRHPAFLA